MHIIYVYIIVYYNIYQLMLIKSVDELWIAIPEKR